jgi:hypothetical protein
MEMSAKGGGWGEVDRMREVGGLVGRRVVVRLGVGKSSPKKNLRSRVRGKKSDKRTSPKRKKMS